MLVKEHARRGNAFVNGVIFYINENRLPDSEDYINKNFFYGAQLAREILTEEQEDDLDIEEAFEPIDYNHNTELNQRVIDIIVSRSQSGEKFLPILRELNIAARTFYSWLERGRREYNTFNHKLYKSLDEAKKLKQCKKEIKSIIQRNLFEEM
jgi:hypothetical protein